VTQSSFAGQVAWITGAGSGIGKALAFELAARGAHVVVSGRRLANLESVAKEIEAKGGKATPITCDVCDEDDVRRAVEDIVREVGRLDVCVANAGFLVSGLVTKLSAEDWRRQFDTNVVGAAMTAKYAIPELLKRGGRLVLIGSVAAFVGAARTGPYSSSKAALRAVGQVLALELHGTGVSTTIIHPGFVESEIAQVDNKGVHDASRDDHRPKQLMWPAEKAARVMANAIHARKAEYVFTGHGKVGAFLGQHAPQLVHFALTHGPAAKAAKKIRPDR